MANVHAYEAEAALAHTYVLSGPKVMCGKWFRKAWQFY
jgi:hypothetical protein